MSIKNKIISGALAAFMIFNPIAPFSTVLADEISEPAETVTIETEASETAEIEEQEETEQTEETVESEVEYTAESEETQPEETEIVISETSETTETRAPPMETEETEPEETENETVIVEASDSEDMLKLISDIPYGYRLIVRAPVDLTDVNVYLGVYFNGSYVLSFENQADYEAAASYFESEGIEYSEDGEFGICGRSGLINNLRFF